MTAQTAVYNKTEDLRQSGAVSGLAKVGWLPSIFVVSVSIPYVIIVGTLYMSPHRFFLLFMLFPAVFSWIYGKAGKKRLSDFCILMFTFWCYLAMITNDGFNESIQGMGMWTIETVGAYFFGRTFVRNSAQFMALIKTFRNLLYVLLPFGFLEAVTQRPVLLEVLGKTGKVIESVYGEEQGRLGLRRAQVAFEHPILYGVFASYGFGLITYGLEKKVVSIKSGFRSLVSPLATFFSLSTGAYLSFLVQLGLTAWEYFTRNVRNRWVILTGILAFCYFTVDALSNRTPFEVFVSYAVFDSGTSYNRILIWQFGTAQVWRTPWFGIGVTGDWERPWWMVSSMDNFFLLLAVRYGLPACICMIVAVASNLRAIIKAPLQSQKLRNIRLGYLFTIFGVLFASATVHFWTATYVFFLFWLGAGVWLADATAEDTETVTGNAEPSPLEQSAKKHQNFRPARKST